MYTGTSSEYVVLQKEKSIRRIGFTCITTRAVDIFLAVGSYRYWDHAFLGKAGLSIDHERVRNTSLFLESFTEVFLVMLSLCANLRF